MAEHQDLGELESDAVKATEMPRYRVTLSWPVTGAVVVLCLAIGIPNILLWRKLDRLQTERDKEHLFWVLCQPGYTNDQRSQAFSELMWQGNREWRSAARSPGPYGAQLRGADVQQAHMEGCNLSVADLAEAVLRQTQFDQADLSGSDLSGADLFEADLLKADLRETVLIRADLRGADIGQSNAAGAKFVSTDMTGARLELAVLTNADLRLARLLGADLGLAEPDFGKSVSHRLVGRDLEPDESEQLQLVAGNRAEFRFDCGIQAELSTVRRRGRNPQARL